MLYQDDPQERRWTFELASIYRKQAELYVGSKELFTAILLYDHGLRLLQTLIPHRPELAKEAQRIHERMAQLHQQLGNVKAAEFHREEAKRPFSKSP